MNLPPAFSYIAWTGLLVTWEASVLSLRNFAQTLEKEAPQKWEALGKPKVGYVTGSPGEMVPFLTKREYLSLNNEKISKAGRWAAIATRISSLFIFVFVAYCVVCLLPNPK